MLITTMNDVPGHEIVEVYGEVFGLTVRSRKPGSTSCSMRPTMRFAASSSQSISVSQRSKITARMP